MTVIFAAHADDILAQRALELLKSIEAKYSLGAGFVTLEGSDPCAGRGSVVLFTGHPSSPPNFGPKRKRSYASRHLRKLATKQDAKRRRFTVPSFAATGCTMVALRPREPEEGVRGLDVALLQLYHERMLGSDIPKGLLRKPSRKEQLFGRHERAGIHG